MMEDGVNGVTLKKVIAIILVIVVVAVIYLGSNAGNSRKEYMEETLVKYMQAVYAPRSMVEFNRAKEESEEIFTKEVTSRFFVSYASELTEADLKRVCETYIAYGAPEHQYDGKERYLITAYLYGDSNSKPIVKEFMFVCNNDGKVEDFTISDPE